MLLRMATLRACRVGSVGSIWKEINILNVVVLELLMQVEDKRKRPGSRRK